jgi:hypothetical protein
MGSEEEYTRRDVLKTSTKASGIALGAAITGSPPSLATRSGVDRNPASRDSNP